MNIQLAGTEEFIDGKSSGSLGQVLIRFVCFFPLLVLWLAGVGWSALGKGEGEGFGFRGARDYKGG